MSLKVDLSAKACCRSVQYIHRITISYNWVIISVVMSSYQLALMLNASLFCIYVVKFNADLRVCPAIKKCGWSKGSSMHNSYWTSYPETKEQAKEDMQFLQLHTSEKVKGLVHKNHIFSFIVKLFSQWY